jgi:hypothetical protein
MSEHEARNKEKQEGVATAYQQKTRDLPSIDFSTFILSMSTSALYQMGLVNGPDGAPVEEPDPLLARQTIDTVQMLRDKTARNLDDVELKLVDNLLYELHTRFLAMA